MLTWEKQRPPGRMGLFKLHHHQEVAMTTMTQALRKLKANLTDSLSQAQGAERGRIYFRRGQMN